MDTENNQPNPTVQADPVEPQTSQKSALTDSNPSQPTPPKQGGFLVGLLSLLLLVSSLTAGFFAWQTQNLVKQINQMQDTPAPEAMGEEISTSDPSASHSPSVSSTPTSSSDPEETPTSFPTVSPQPSTTPSNQPQI